MRSAQVPNSDGLAEAAGVVRRYLQPSPVLPAPLLGDAVVLKVETLQPTGSFKVRGALAAVAAASGRTDGPLVTVSAGNHGLGFAYAAERIGVAATVVVPETASEAKVRSLRRFAVTLVCHGASYDEAEAHALRLVEERGGHFVSPYNDPDVIAGQATVGTELLEQVLDLATVVVPAGGGGLLSGISLAVAGTGISLFGVEAAASRALSASMAAGTVVAVPVASTIADGLAGNLEPGSVTVEICRTHGVEVLAVEEGALRDGVRFLAFEHGLVAEGSGAAAVAAIRSGRIEVSGPTAVVVTGRNITPALLTSILSTQR